MRVSRSRRQVGDSLARSYGRVQWMEPSLPSRRRDARRVRRRRRRSTSRMAISLVAAVLAARSVEAVNEDETGPGRVAAADTSDALQVGVLTTRCSAVCSSESGAMACLGVGVDRASCAASRQMRGTTCQSLSPASSALCLAPADTARWTLLLTTDAELLTLAKRNVSVVDDSFLQNAIVLNASDVGAIANFDVPETTTQLTITSVASDKPEKLPLQITSDLVASWPSLERLSVRNLDLSSITTFPAFPKLGSLDVSNTRLRMWSASATPALSNLDVSSNELTDLPNGSLPLSLNVLNVSSNSLVEFPVDIASLTSLFRLSVSNNNLAKLSEIPKLPALQELYLSSANLTAVPAGMANLPALQVLDLSNNNFEAAMNNAFPASLNTLHLRSCNLKMLPGDFGIEKNWAHVDLSENPFAPNAFAGVKLRVNNLILDQTQLTSISSNIKTWAIGNKLSLSRNALGAVDGDDLPRDIAELRLADCFLTEVPPNLTPLKRLTILDLSENRLGPIFKGSFPRSLTELYLANCRLGNVPIDVNSMNSTLQKLDLSGNNITEVSLDGFTSLRQLNLRNNSLAAFPSSAFNLTGLASLDLRGNPMSNVLLTDAQIAFLSSLRYFEIDDSAFGIRGTCVEYAELRGKYKVCKNAVASNTLEPIGTDVPGSISPIPTQSTTSKASSPNTTLNIVLGCAVAIVILVSVLVTRLAPRRSSIDNEAFGALETGTNRYGPIDMWDDPELLQLRVDILDIELVMQIGIGANSVIWLARYQTDTVVVKRLYYKKSEPRTFERFVEEIKFLGRLQHENIVQFMGVSWTSQADLQMVLEFMANGDLHKYLHTTRADEGARPWSARKIRIAMDVARALTYLHSHDPAMFHRDLRSHHVLLNEKYTAKLTDFGMCRHRVEEIDIMAADGNSGRSIAPEVLSGRGARGRAVDMYAFGVILAELDSHELPFSDITLSSGAPLSEMAMLELLSTGALQPAISPDCPQDIAALILDCLAFDAKRRPTAPEALMRLQVVMDSFQALGHAPDNNDDSSRRIVGSYFDSKHEEDEDDHMTYGI